MLHIWNPYYGWVYNVAYMDGCTMLNTWVVGHYCISMDITLHNVLSPLCQVYIGGQHMNEKKHHSSFSALIFFFINQWNPANYDKYANVGNPLLFHNSKL